MGDTVGSVSAAGSRGHFVLLDKDERFPTADLSNIGCPNGPACLTAVEHAPDVLTVVCLSVCLSFFTFFFLSFH